MQAHPLQERALPGRFRSLNLMAIQEFFLVVLNETLLPLEPLPFGATFLQ